jgi:hypothetical protein
MISKAQDASKSTLIHIRRGSRSLMKLCWVAMMMAAAAAFIEKVATGKEGASLVETS